MNTGAVLPRQRKRRRTPVWIKSIGRSGAVHGFVCLLIAAYIQLVWVTGRWRILGDEHAREHWQNNEPFLLAFWHGKLLMMPKCWQTRMPMNVLISNHRDGEMIARSVRYFGIGAVRGSSAKRRDKGGAKALRAMLKAVKSGEALAITPDGPSGPRMRASLGIVTTAKLAGVPIIPATVAARSRKIVKSWDRFLIPLPFTRGVILWGEPIVVDRQADDTALELAREMVEQALNDISREADLLVNAKPIEPAEDLQPAQDEA